ncbi:MAG: hypothetical protein MRJ93_11655 [Nitrososphaeraceae archaeon]|nr:hypothetical protein [Nitrososphaeraceae archaeon]
MVEDVTFRTKIGKKEENNKVPIPKAIVDNIAKFEGKSVIINIRESNTRIEENEEENDIIVDADDMDLDEDIKTY